MSAWHMIADILPGVNIYPPDEAPGEGRQNNTLPLPTTPRPPSPAPPKPPSNPTTPKTNSPASNRGRR